MASKAGRPPGPTDETRAALLMAAFRLLVEEGPSSLTPMRLHRETGIARTTVYRHWPTSRHIVEDVMTFAIARHELDDLTGELDHDLPIAVATLTYRFEHRPVSAFYRAALSVDADDEDPPLSRRYIAGLVAPVRDVLATALGDGRLSGDVDELTSELCGPLLLDHLLLGRPVDQASVASSIERFLRRAAAR